MNEPRPPRRLFGLGSGQIVTAQLAILLVLISFQFGKSAAIGAMILAAMMVVLAWGRSRGRWMSEWLVIGLRYKMRKPRIDFSEVANGLTALIEIGDTSALPSQGYALPSPASLLPDMPPVRIQLLLQAIAVNGATPVGSSYRQLTGGRLLAGERALLAVWVQPCTEWSQKDLEQAVRKVRSKLGDIPNRLLGEVAARRALDEVTGHDSGQPAAEGWSALHLGGLLQSTYKVERWAHPNVERLLQIPATMTVLSLTADQVSAQLMVRLAAPDQTSLAAAGNALEQMVSARRLDGEQFEGLLATLPLARPSMGASIGAEFTTPYGGSGLMIGVNRHNEPVSFRLFRPEATRAVLIGGVPVAQLIATRAMALGAYILVQTNRPQAWEAFSRGLGVGARLTVLPPGPVTLPAGSPTRPLLTVIDAGPAAADRSAGSPWHSTLVVRDDLSPADVDLLGRADLAILQPLNPAEAAVAVSVLGLSRDQEAWLSRAHHGMVGVVHRRSIRWAALSQTSYEQQLIGSTGRGR